MDCQNTSNRVTIAAWLVSAAFLFLVITLHLLPALLAGLLVYQLVNLLTPLLTRRLSDIHARRVAVALVASIVVIFITLAAIATMAFLRSEAAGLPTILNRIIEVLRNYIDLLPPSISSAVTVPTDADGLNKVIVNLLHKYSTELGLAGKHFVRGAVYALIGMVIGALLAIYEIRSYHNRRPLVLALAKRAGMLAESFHRVVFAQVRISGINTIFTAIYLAVVLPMLGIHLPLTNSLIAVTFIVGLLPVIGNLISNTIIVIVSLTYSPHVAVSSLIFLVSIHKLEYFLNARIVGSRINACAWEMLLAMLVMEAAFGLAGLVAAPIYYAYLKDELSTQGCV